MHSSPASTTDFSECLSARHISTCTSQSTGYENEEIVRQASCVSATWYIERRRKSTKNLGQKPRQFASHNFKAKGEVGRSTCT